MHRSHFIFLEKMTAVVTGGNFALSSLSGKQLALARAPHGRHRSFTRQVGLSWATSVVPPPLETLIQRPQLAVGQLLATRFNMSIPVVAATPSMFTKKLARTAFAQAVLLQPRPQPGRVNPPVKGRLTDAHRPLILALSHSGDSVNALTPAPVSLLQVEQA